MFDLILSIGWIMLDGSKVHNNVDLEVVIEGWLEASNELKFFGEMDFRMRNLEQLLIQ